MSIQHSLQRILSPRPTPADAEPFVALALRIATLHMQKKIASGAINPAFFGLSTADLAVDCVGPLFERDAQGRFVQLLTYYVPLRWEELDETELLAYTRRLVFSKIHQQLARLYKETDPSLEKLMRNLRNAMRSGRHLAEVRRGNELWAVIPGYKEQEQGLPLMPWEFLEGELTPRIHASTTLKDIVRCTAEIFEGQKVYRRSYPFTSLALIVRTAFVRVGGLHEIEHHDHTLELAPHEIRQAVHKATARIASAKQETYVAQGRVDKRIYDAYMDAARTILQAEFVENDGHDKSFYERLAEKIPGMSTADYQHHHRCHFEYLVKLSREELLKVVKQEF
jgi:hypothetical protein